MMLPILAGLLLAPVSPLPSPYLSTALRPAMPIEGLRDAAPYLVVRGSFWRRPGYFRISYFYRFPPNQGPEYEQILAGGKFTETPGLMTEIPTKRAERSGQDMRQVVQYWDLKLGEGIRSAQAIGPGRVWRITEIPISDKEPPKWPQSKEFREIPLPPGWPPPYASLQGMSITAVYSDPLLVMNARRSVNIVVTGRIQRSFDEVRQQLSRELTGSAVEYQRLGDSLTYRFKDTRFGLMQINLAATTPQSEDKETTEVNISYSFRDPINSPRIE